MAVDIPMPKKYTDSVSTIVPVTKGNWAGSAEKASDKKDKHSKHGD